MRRFTSSLSVCTCLGLLAGGAQLRAQELSLTPCTTGIGRRVDYTLSGGQAFRPFLFLSSLKRGSFPLSALDPRDKRTIGVGFDLLGLLLLGSFDAQGKAAFSFPLPNDPALAGRSLLHQAIAFPGTKTSFGPMSQVAVVPFEVPGAWRSYAPRTMGVARAWLGVIPQGNGRHLVCGGGTGGLLALTSWKTTEVYDVATRTFTAGPNLTVERGVFTTSRLPDGRTLLVGGVNAKNDPQKTADFYNPTTNSFTAAPPMKDLRMAHTATTLKDGRILVTGGLSDLNNQLAALGSALKSTEIFDPKTGTWAQGPAMTIPRAGHTAVRLADGRVLLAGGVTWVTFIIKIPSFSSKVDVFDPKTGKITAVKSMAVARATHQATRLPDGRVLVAGGIGGSIANGGTPLSSCEIWNPATNTWGVAKSLPGAKGLMGSAWLADGTFAIVGGARGSLLSPLAVATCEAYDPKTGAWTALPKLGTPRATQLTFVLPSCMLLAIGGGTGASGAAVNTHEMLIR